MDITNVTLNLLSGPGKSKAIGDIVLNDELVVKGIRVVEGSKGLFVGFPSKKVDNPKEGQDEYQDLVFPKTKEFREQVQKAVLAKFEEVLAA